MFRARVLLPLVLFGLYGAYYYFSNRQTVPLTGRKHMVDMSTEQEAALGFQSYRQILAKSQVVQGGKVVDLVRDIGRKIAAVSEDPGFKWEFNVIQSQQVNAFCLPGGKVAVYTGILPVAKNSDGLAVIMGHEIAHAIARHGAERMAQEKLVRIGQIATQIAVGDMSYDQQRMVMGAFGLGAQYGLLLPFSREHESEADYMGLIFVARACMDPREAPKLWERMGEVSGKSPAQFTSTHPSHATRIRQFEKWMPEALQIRKERCGAS
jgi:metalloendopeptidase OMA1, mitochondrial